MFSAVQKKSGGSKFFCEGRQTILQGTRQRMKISIRSWILQNVVFIQLLLYIKLYVWFYLKDIYWFLICKLLLQWAFTPLWCWWLNIFCYFIFRKIQLFIVCLLTVHKQDFAQKNFNAKNKNKRKMKKNTKVDLCRVFHTNCNCPEKNVTAIHISYLCPEFPSS